MTYQDLKKYKNMNQYLSLFLKRKETDIDILLVGFCTTPARELSSCGAFPYTTSKVNLDKNQVTAYLSAIIENRDKFKRLLEKIVQKKSELEQVLYKCSSKEVGNILLEKIEDSKQSILELTETIDNWNFIIDRISFAIDVWNNNKEEWELYYINC